MAGTTGGMDSVEDERDEDTRVLDVLGDGDCRRLLALLAAEGPQSVRDLHDATGMAQSTLYRKVHRLSATPLVGAETHLMEGGRQPTAYRVVADTVEVDVDDPVDVRIEGADDDGDGPTGPSRRGSGPSGPSREGDGGRVEAPHRG